MKYKYIEAQWINALMRAFENYGLNTQHITEGLAGFEHGQMIVGTRLEVSAAREIWHRADKLAQDPLLGLKIGSSQDYRAIGVLAPILWHSPSVRIALNNIATFQTLISESGSFLLTEIQESEGSKIQCEYVAVPNMVPVNGHQVLAVLIGTMGIIQAISNKKTKVKQLYLPPSLNGELISLSLGCQVKNREGNLVICFSTEQFDQPLLGCDKHLYHINLAYAEELLRSKRASLALIDSIKSIIEQYGFSTATIDDAVTHLGLNKRTLQRNLMQQGTSFRKLKEEVLKEWAVKMLVRQRFEIDEIAQRLGYSEPSAFHRAFKTWFSSTPKHFTTG